MGKVVLPAIDVDDFVSGQDNKLRGHTVASGAAYLVETNRFDSQAGVEARYKRGVPKAFLKGYVRARCGARVGTPHFYCPGVIRIE